VALGVAALVVGCAAVPAAGRAEALRSVPVSGAVVDGTVNSVLPVADRVYLGGGFTYAGPLTGSGVPLRRAGAAPAAGVPRVDGSVDASTPDGAGGFYVGGEFTQVGAVRRWGVVHVSADGRVDPGFASDLKTGSGGLAVAGSVRALALSGSTLYVGGAFDSIGGQPRSGIAAVDARTGAVSAWSPNPDRAGNANALAVSRRRLYAGGSFSSFAGGLGETLAIFAP
jgi:hypothetical protein